MDSSLFSYTLPPGRIAQTPSLGRDLSKLMVVDRAGGVITVDRFFNLPRYLSEGDVVVVNDSRVVPARLYGRKERAGGRVEVLLTGETEGGDSTGFIGGKVGRGERIVFEGDHRGEVVEKEGNRITLRWLTGGGRAPLREIGHIPTPPYIRRRESPRLESLDRSRYQTIFARDPGSIAAPTAGLHFSPRVLNGLRDAGVEVLTITLHVGPGTFLPITEGRVEDHRLEGERYRIPPETAGGIARARRGGGRVVAVGTTVVRTLEANPGPARTVEAGEGVTDLFITPGFTFRVVDRLVTNFHLPRSSLLVLVAAFAGRDIVMEAYRRAIEGGFRFYSYGDAMLVL